MMVFIPESRLTVENGHVVCDVALATWLLLSAWAVRFNVIFF